MVTEESVLTLEYYNYKGVFTGSMKGIRYRIEKLQEETEVYFWVHIWDEPYSYEATSKEEMVERKFAFSYEGRKELVEWINAYYEGKQKEPAGNVQ